MTTIIVPSHLPKINPPSSAIGEPKPKNGKTHNIVKIKKIMDIKNKIIEKSGYSEVFTADEHGCDSSYEQIKNSLEQKMR